MGGEKDPQQVYFLIPNTDHHHFRRRKRRKTLTPNCYKPEPEKGLPKAAPENRILTRSCGKTEAVVDEPVIREVPETISAPEEVRIVVVPRTAANTTANLRR